MHVAHTVLSSMGNGKMHDAMTSELETRLRNAADKIDKWHDEHCKEDWYPGHVDRDEVNMFRNAADTIAALKAKLARAKGALRPIAAFWDAYHQQSRMQRADDDIWDEIDADGPYAAVTFGDIRRAAAVLAELDKP